MSGAILFTPDAAKRLGLSDSTLEKWRVSGEGPAFIQLGKWRVAYPVDELDRWLAERPRIRSTAEYEKRTAARAGRRRSPDHRGGIDGQDQG